LAAPHLPLDRQHREMPDECIDMEEKDPDIIPTNKDIIEEEEAFQAYAEQRRYASTLGRTCSGNGNNTGAQHCRREATDGEKIRNLKGNISRLSQEVSSYAEWTMPRMHSKGYTPISARNCTDSPVSSVHFAKIDGGSGTGGHHHHTMTLTRPPRPPTVPPRYTSPPGVGAESSTSSSTLSQKMENSSTSGMTTSGSGIATGCGDAPREARPARFQVGGPGIESDCNLLAETPLVSFHP